MYWNVCAEFPKRAVDRCISYRFSASFTVAARSQVVTADHRNAVNIKITDDVTWAELGDEIVILNLASGIYFSIGGVGRRFWELIADGAPFDSAVKELTAEFDVETERLKRDLVSLVDQLRSEGLVALSE
jgi:hypothetical protein